jgi:hypothetical protein
MGWYSGFMEQVPGWYVLPDTTSWQTNFRFWFAGLAKPNWFDDEEIPEGLEKLGLQFRYYHLQSMQWNPKNQGLQITQETTQRRITVLEVFWGYESLPEVPAETDDCLYVDEYGGFRCNGSCKAFESL